VSRKSVRLVVFRVLLIVALVQAMPVLAQAPDLSCSELPRHVEVSDYLKPAVATLLRKSPTFRHQCEILAASTRVRIVLLGVPPPYQSTAPRAKATMHRYSYGLLRAEIEIPLTSDHTELIPHELEHVIEQLEGLDLPSLSRDGDDRVMRVTDGAFETRRAQAAGRTAAREVRGDDTDPAVSTTMRAIGRAWRGLASRAAREARSAIPSR
jgi:hypothetical protein